MKDISMVLFFCNFHDTFRLHGDVLFMLIYYQIYKLIALTYKNRPTIVKLLFENIIFVKLRYNCYLNKWENKKCAYDDLQSSGIMYGTEKGRTKGEVFRVFASAPRNIRKIFENKLPDQQI